MGKKIVATYESLKSNNPKGQLISKYPFGVFKSNKKSTKFL